MKNLKSCVCCNRSFAPNSIEETEFIRVTGVNAALSYLDKKTNRTGTNFKSIFLIGIGAGFFMAMLAVGYVTVI